MPHIPASPDRYPPSSSSESTPETANILRFSALSLFQRPLLVSVTACMNPFDAHPLRCAGIVPARVRPNNNDNDRRG